jgi:hypothetical protein
VPAEGNLVVEPSTIARPGLRLGDAVDVTVTAWAVDREGPSRQLGTITFALTLGAPLLNELTSRGFKAPDRVVDALIDATTGQRISMTLEPTDAFGILQAPRPLDVPLSAFSVEPAVGMPFLIEDQAETYWVVSIQGGNVRLDVNHPWAGYPIRLDGVITATQRRETTPSLRADVPGKTASLHLTGR